MARKKQDITTKKRKLLKKSDNVGQKDSCLAYRQQLIQKIIEGYYTFQPNAKNKRLGFIKTLVYHQLFKYLYKQIRFNDYIKSFVQIIDSDFSALQSDINQKNIVIETQAQQIADLYHQLSQANDRLDTAETNHSIIKKSFQEIKSIRNTIAKFKTHQSKINNNFQQIKSNNEDLSQNILTIDNRLNSNYELIKKSSFPQSKKSASPGSKVFYSQFGEDTWIVNNLKLPKTGVFVDVGAADGITFSNTYYFEKQGWTGVCFEPNPENFNVAKLVRRNVYPIAISSNFGKADFYIDSNTPDWSGLEPLDIKTSKKIQVETKTLTQALFDQKFINVDLLSVDTEGTEIDVIKSLDFSQFLPTILIIEFLNRENVNQSKMLVKFISQFGYKVAHTTFSNLIFVQK